MEIHNDLAVLFTALAAAIAVGAFVVKTALPFLHSKVAAMLGITRLRDSFKEHLESEETWQESVTAQLDVFYSKLDLIVKEFKPNSGETIRDALNRIETNVDLNGERFRARMLDTEEMLFEADPEGNVIWVNRTLARMTRRMPGEILGNGWINMLHPEDRDAIRHAWHEAIREEVELETELRIISTEGEILPVICKAYLMHDVNGLVIGWLVSFKDKHHAHATESSNPESRVSS